MSDDDKDEGEVEEPSPPPETPLERPTTDTKLISDMDVPDAALAIRDALGPDHGRTDEEEGGSSAGAVKGRLDSVEERLERLVDLEERFSNIEKAIDDLRAKLEEGD